MKQRKMWISLTLAVAALTSCMAGCASALPMQPQQDAKPEIIDISAYTGELEIVPLADSAAVATTMMPVASGIDVRANSKAAIDVSNMKNGYVMVQYTAGGTAKIKVIITGPSGVKYTYNLNSKGTYEVFPLSDGNGKYTIGVYKNVSGTQYATEYVAAIHVKLQDEFAPFLLPNQYVNYTEKSKTVTKGAELTKKAKTELDAVKAVYDWVIANISYDKELAATVQSGYLPVLDDVLTKKKGICFDYAALMTAMLRSQGIPCKLVVGYAGKTYHAWIDVYSEKEGWITGAIYFNGEKWERMDPTFASSGKSSDAIMSYIGNGKNYTVKYLY